MDNDALALHRTAYVADAHADSLMWNRDLTVLSTSGHVDFPRLAEAGVNLQCFTLVTRGFPLVDGFATFARYQGWPKESVKSEWLRANWQIDRLEEFCRKSEGKVTIAKSAGDLKSAYEQGAIAAVLGVEGGHALEGRIENLAELHRRGVRFIGLTHLSNNALGGSSFPMMGNRGLTQHGLDVLGEMHRLRLSVDLAHASMRSLDEIVREAKRASVRLFCSHAGVQGATANWRNLPDEILKAIADDGGVVGVIFAPIYLGGKTIDDVARHIEHAVNVMGEDAVGYGSDYDGFVALPKQMRDVRDLPLVTEALLRRGHPRARVEKIIGGNLRRFFSETL